MKFAKKLGSGAKIAVVLACGLTLAVLAGCAAKQSAPVMIEVTDAGFVPPVVYVSKGKPARLVVTRTTDATCATELVFAKNGDKYDLPLNQPVTIDLPARDADTLSYACGMNMFGGKVVVR